MELADVLRAIESGDFDDVGSLWDIRRACNRRERAILPKQNTDQFYVQPKVRLFDLLKVGDRVKVTHGIRPRYVIGNEATVRKVNKIRAIVDFDAPLGNSGRFYKNVSIPMDCLKKVEV